MALPNIFATEPAGNVQASLLDQNFTFIESQGVQGLTTTGSSNTYVATPADAWSTGYTSYVARALTLKPNFTNTGASTLNVSGLGAASIYKNVGGTQTALASGDIVSGIPAIVICDGTGFLLVNPTSTTGVVTVKTQSFTSSGTYTPSTGMLYCSVRMVGGGGAGGGVAATGAGQVACAGGGGAGEYAQGVFSAATIGTSQTVTIGAAGAAPTAGNNAGGNGGTTSLGSLLTAVGGNGGTGGAASGANPGNAGGTGGTGGTGTGDHIQGSQGGLGYGIAASNFTIGGEGAGSLLGAWVVNSNGALGSDGAGYGSGGAGSSNQASSSARSGGAGTKGAIFITEFCSQ